MIKYKYESFEGTSEISYFDPQAKFHKAITKDNKKIILIHLPYNKDASLYANRDSGFDLFNEFITQDYLAGFSFKIINNSEIEHSTLWFEETPNRKKYKLANALTSVNEQPYFSSEKDAWNYLRKAYSNSRYITLFRQEEIKIRINNQIKYVESYNSKYGPPPIGHGGEDSKLLDANEPFITSTNWVPVLDGVTGDEYNID